MAWIRDLPSGHYQACWRDPRNRLKTRTFMRKGDARRFLVGLESAKLKGEYVDPNAGKILYREWEARWWATTLNLRPTTRIRDRILLDRHVLPRFADVPLGALEQVDVRRWVAVWMHAASRQPRSRSVTSCSASRWPRRSTRV